MSENKKVSRMMHDISSPVQGVMGLAELIGVMDDIDSIKETAKKIVSESERISSFIRFYQTHKEEFADAG